MIQRISSSLINHHKNVMNIFMISFLYFCCCCFNHVTSWTVSSSSSSSSTGTSTSRLTTPHRPFLSPKGKSNNNDNGISASTITEDDVSTSSPIDNNIKYDHNAWKNGFTTCPNEITPTCIDFPNLPNDFPIGTLYRNGHGRFESDDGIKVLHPFDGDGLLSAITFDSNTKRILFRNRFINTAGYNNDKRTGTMSVPGIFGTKVSGGFIRNMFRTDFKNVANTHVLYSKTNQMLYALWEGGKPYRINPYTLECNPDDTKTNGYNMNGILNNDDDNIAAHYRYDPISNTIVDFSTKLNPNDGTSTIKIYEFHADTMEPIHNNHDAIASVIINCPALIHDFVLTKNWCIYSIPPSKLNQIYAFKALLGLSSFASVIDFTKQNDDDQTKIIMIPRHNTNNDMIMTKIEEDKRIKIINVPFHFGFHFANGYEDSDGNVVFDIVQMKKASFAQAAPKVPAWETMSWENDLYGTTYVRYVIDPHNEVMIKPPQTIVQNRNTEFPTIPYILTTQKFRYSYTIGSHSEVIPSITTGTGAGPGGSIIKIDTEQPNNTEIYTFQSYEFVGEPIFVPKVNAKITNPLEEDHGYVVVYINNGKDMTTELVIFDVQGRGKLQSGPIAKLQLPTFIPFGLHGIFVEDLTFDF